MTGNLNSSHRVSALQTRTTTKADYLPRREPISCLFLPPRTTKSLPTNSHIVFQVQFIHRSMEIKRCNACGSLKWKDSDEHHVQHASVSDQKSTVEAMDLPAAVSMVDTELEHLNSLRHSLDALHEENRSAGSPIRRVPAELWSAIFEFYREMRRSDLSVSSIDNNKGMAVHLPLLLVSRKWRDIA
ncbi:hypothetical protein C8R43DRAFT_1230520, partial [Mycena crocata]